MADLRRKRPSPLKVNRLTLTANISERTSQDLLPVGFMCDTEDFDGPDPLLSLTNGILLLLHR